MMQSACITQKPLPKTRKFSCRSPPPYAYCTPCLGQGFRARAPEAVLANAGEEGQQATLAKSLLASSLLSQGTPIISQDALDDPSLAAFVSSVVQFRRNHSALLQPHHFSSSRELVWHGATIGCCPAVHVLHTAAQCCPMLHRSA